jgi:hypothetical protein
MINAEIHRNGELLMTRVYDEPGLTLQMVAERLASYVEEERLNEIGECQLRVRRTRVAERRATKGAASDLAAS